MNGQASWHWPVASLASLSALANSPERAHCNRTEMSMFPSIPRLPVSHAVVVGFWWVGIVTESAVGSQCQAIKAFFFLTVPVSVNSAVDRFASQDM